MAKLVNFVQVLIIFLSLIVLATSDCKFFLKHIQIIFFFHHLHNVYLILVNSLLLLLLLFDITDRVFCSTNDDCKHNECGAAYVPECLWIVCTCQPRLKSN
jgi:hypothetical protein